MTDSYAMFFFIFQMPCFWHLPISPRIGEAILQGILVDELDLVTQPLLRGPTPKAVDITSPTSSDVKGSRFHRRATPEPNTKDADHPKIPPSFFCKHLTQPCKHLTLPWNSPVLQLPPPLSSCLSPPPTW